MIFQTLLVRMRLAGRRRQAVTRLQDRTIPKAPPAVAGIVARTVLAVCGLICSTSQALAAEGFTLRDAWEDAQLYVTAPTRWDYKDWSYFGGTLAAIAAAHEFDGTVRRDLAGSHAALDGKDKHSLRDAAPAAAALVGTWVASTLLDDNAGRVEAYTMLEAAGFAAVTTEALKFAAGRSRPNETTHVDAWRKGGSSFPSLHASAAFAIGTVLAESGNDDYRWLRRLLGYGIAGATAYIRLRDNVHWTSDVVAATAIGISTAHFTLNRRETRAKSWELSVSPLDSGGAMLSFSMPLR